MNKTLTIYACGVEQRYYEELSQKQLDILIDEWQFQGSTVDCDDSKTNWTIVLI